jgi:hypothetical protein
MALQLAQRGVTVIARLKYLRRLTGRPFLFKLKIKIFVYFLKRE